jgi:hypothetical protein
MPVGSKKILKNSGYMGLIMMLISVVIMALLVWKFGLLAGKSGGVKATPQEDLQAIQKAQDLKNALEQRDRQLLQQ